MYVYINSFNVNIFLVLIYFSWQVCDISSISDIKSFASRFSSKDVPVHILVSPLL